MTSSCFHSMHSQTDHSRLGSTHCEAAALRGPTSVPAINYIRVPCLGDGFDVRPVSFPESSSKAATTYVSRHRIDAGAVFLRVGCFSQQRCSQQVHLRIPPDLPLRAFEARKQVQP